MALTKKMWADPKFRMKMREAIEKAKLLPKVSFVDVDPDAVDSEGNQLRPAYIPVTPGPRPRYDTEALEKSLESFCEEARECGWVDQEPKKKAKHKPNPEFNAGPLSFSKEKLDEWNSRQKDVEIPVDDSEEVL